MKNNKHVGAKVIFGILLVVFCILIYNFTIETGNFVYSLLTYQKTVSSEVPVIMHIEKSAAFYDVSQTAHINNAAATLSLSKAPFSLQVFYGIYRMLLVGSIIICFGIMLKIITTVFMGDPFTPQNGRRLKVLALIIAIVPLILQISVNYVANKTISQLTFLNLTLRSEVMGRSTLTVCLFAGLLLYAISEVFRIGTSMKEEQELTV